MKISPVKPAVLGLADPLTSLPGVKSGRAAQLARLGLHTVEDLLSHTPRRYEDRRQGTPIGQLRAGAVASVSGRIMAQGLKTVGSRQQSVFEVVLEDATGRLYCRWWNQPFLQRRFHVGDELWVFGKTTGGGPFTLDNPETERLEDDAQESIHRGRIVPVYPLTEGLSQRGLRALVWRTLEQVGPALVEPEPPLVLADLPSHVQAVHDLHFPAERDAAEKARQRLAFEEFLDFQLELQRRRLTLEQQAQARSCSGDNRWIRPFLGQLAYALTLAQTRVLRELRRDLAGPLPMRRLLQGDVGSGKTVVAACVALMALESGFNAVLMAPTEVLAEQHFQTFTQWFTPLGLSVHLRTGSRKCEPDASSVAPRLVIGTHALIEAGFDLENLGLVIIDEQHKFGVTQRERLVRKGHYPHLLVMTATPIPRTLGLTLYGDLDCSVLDQMPPGRGRVRTFVRGPDRLPKVWEFVRNQLAAGRQAYVVYPLVEESESPDLKAVTAEWEALQTRLAPYPVGLLHGRLKADDKARVLADFRARQCAVLVATTVIEVGLDVANATVMLIENAEQFGLAQLHQLRGRIGRGADTAYCILVPGRMTADAKERLRILETTTDGFQIAEADLRLRGPGDFLGPQQSGLPPLRFGDLTRDLPLIERARQQARSPARAALSSVQRRP